MTIASRIVGGYLTCFVATWVALSYVTGNFDPSEWSRAERSIHVIASVLGAAWIAFAPRVKP